MASWNQSENPNNLRIIKTGRDEESINLAAKSGFRPLVKKIVPSKKIHSKYAVYQNKETGEIEVTGDLRYTYRNEGIDGFDLVIPFTDYYPHNFKSPFAAYLVPQDLQIGEQVFLEDLIEDYVGMTWNQGDNYRLESCEAIWNGKDFEIQYDPKSNRTYVVG